INPGESGCTQNRQCEAVWPGAYCRSGECRCANNQPPFRTRDGLVCLNYGFCPLNGNNPKFRIENQVQQCYGGADATCEAIGALAYDCVCDSDDCTVNNPISFCCPSRAFACIQPPNEGYTPPGGGTTSKSLVPRSNYRRMPRAEISRLRRKCQQFPDKGSIANHTVSKLATEVFLCTVTERQESNKSLCIVKAMITAVTIRIISALQWVLSSNVAQPTCSFALATVVYLRRCTIQPVVFQQEYFDVGIPDGTGTTSPRFYYDSREGRCIQFSYLGQGGNFNNFLSQDHCEKFCSRILCSAGEPLKDSSGERNMECSPTGSGANSCPSTHSCESTSGSTTFGGVCCPRPQYVCKLPREQGNCGTYSNRWWFNAKTGNCEEFIYSGCQGNANNFETYKECQDYCRDAR
ncbi:Kunitz/Bovine pancreatic trypsin inhibitor domain protein, partial [Cooperia oncophora]